MKCKKMLSLFLAVAMLLATLSAVAFAADVSYYDIAASAPLMIGKSVTLSLTKTESSVNIQSDDATVTEITEGVTYTADDSSLVQIEGSTATALGVGMTKVTANYEGKAVATMMLVVGTKSSGMNFNSSNTEPQNEQLGNALGTARAASTYYQYVTKPAHGTTGTSIYLPNIPYANYNPSSGNNYIRKNFLTPFASDASQITELWLYNDCYGVDRSFQFWTQGLFAGGKNFRAVWQYTANNALKISNQGGGITNYQFNGAVGNGNGTWAVWGRGWNQIVVACSDTSYDIYINGVLYLSIVGNSKPTGALTIVFDRFATANDVNHYMYLDDYNVYSCTPTTYYDLAIEAPLALGDSAPISLTQTTTYDNIRTAGTEVVEVTEGVTYTSSDESIVKIENGQAVAVGIGSSVITANVGGKAVATMMALVGSKVDAKRDYTSSNTKAQDEVLRSLQAYSIQKHAPFQYVTKPAHGTSGTSLYLGNMTTNLSDLTGSNWFYKSDCFDTLQSASNQATEFWLYYDGYTDNRTFQFWSQGGFTGGKVFRAAIQFEDGKLIFAKQGGDANVYGNKDLKRGWNQIVMTCDDAGYTFFVNGSQALKIVYSGSQPTGAFTIRFDRYAFDHVVNHYVYLDDYAVYNMTPAAQVTSIDDYPVQAAKDDKEEYAAMRFIFKALVPSDVTVDNYGAYVVPWEVFSPNYDETTIEDADPIKKVGETIENNTTYSVDLYGIPASAFGKDIYALPFINSVPNVAAAYQKSVEAALAQFN